MTELLELQGMARVVKYLRERARRTYHVIEASTEPHGDFHRAHALKAVSLIEAANMVEEGISQSLLDKFGCGPVRRDRTNYKRWTVCPECGAWLMVREHDHCPSPCHDDHVEKCPNGHG